MRIPPCLSLSDHFGEVRVTLRNLELPRDRVLGVGNERIGILVILRTQEGSDHDYVIHTEQVGIERGLQGIILRNVICPILRPLGGLELDNRIGLTFTIHEQGVPHTAEDGDIMEEIAEGLVEVTLAVHIGRGTQVGHDVSLAHIGNLLGFDGLTCNGVDGVLERLLIGLGDLTPHFKGRRPRIQAENGSEAGCRDLLRTLGRVYDDRLILPDHALSPPSISDTLVRIASQSVLLTTVKPCV